MSSSSIQPILLLLSAQADANPTQYMVEKVFAHHDLDWRYLTVEVAADRLGEALTGVKALGFCGGHFCDSHKQTSLTLMDALGEAAEAIGMVNCFTRDGDGLRGDNLEGQGLLGALNRVVDTAGKRVVLLGAGRLARAVAYELATAGVAEIRVVNRTEENAQALAHWLAGRFPSLPVAAAAWVDPFEVPAEADLLIHATSLGQEEPDGPWPLLTDSLRKELVVADATIAPSPTWLLHEAAARGCRIVDGLDAFIEQCAISLARWTGVDPNRMVMREAAEEFLEV